jgi:hypothetical protein
MLFGSGTAAWAGAAGATTRTTTTIESRSENLRIVAPSIVATLD